MRPLGASADQLPIVSLAASNVRAAMPKALQLSGNPGGVTLFNQTIIFRRSSPVPRTTGSAQYQVKGSVSLLNPDSQLMQVKEVQVQVTSAKPVIVKASCPSNSVKSATAPAAGTIISIPPSAGKASDQFVSCTYTAPVSGSSQAETLAIVLMEDGRLAQASDPVTVDLTAAKPVALGGCVKISEAQVMMDPNTNEVLEQQAVLVGSKVPVVAEELCYTKSFQAIGQIGPLQAASNTSGAALFADCGGVAYNSTVTAQPTSGPQGKLVSSGSIVLSVEDC